MLLQTVLGGGYMREPYENFQPLYPYILESELSSCYKTHEKMKKNISSACNLHSTCSLSIEGLTNKANHFYKRVASQLAVKWDQSHSCTIMWLCYRLTFSLLWSAIQCFRGARSSVSEELGRALGMPRSTWHQLTLLPLSTTLMYSVLSPFEPSCWVFCS